MSEETLRKLALGVRNWGRWGPDDELGTLNYITPDTIAAAARLVTAGKVFALGIPLDRQGPQTRDLDRGDWRNFDLDPFPGVSVYTTAWMHDKQIAAAASDNYAVEVRPIPSTRSRFRTWGSRSGRSSFWKSWPPTALPTAALRSCSSRRRSRSRAPSARRSIPTRSSRGASLDHLVRQPVSIGSDGSAAHSESEAS
jgi:hypothetical protein